VTPLSPGTTLATRANLKTKVNPFVLAIPALFDCVGSTLMNVALTQCAASVYQMMRGIIVVITAIFSVIFLGKKQYVHHIISLIIIVIAVAIVGLASVLLAKKDDDESSKGNQTTFLGILLLLLAQCFTGGQFIVEEKFLGDYYLDPLQAVGLEGFWGCVYYAILLPIFQFVKCEG
jgi:drug/metabolite transporter (DMT)-like permease